MKLPSVTVSSVSSGNCVSLRLSLCDISVAGFAMLHIENPNMNAAERPTVAIFLNFDIVNNLLRT